MLDDKLETRVKAVNNANAHAFTLYVMLADIFRPLVGTTIYKKDGALLKSVKELLPEIESTPRLQVLQHRSAYNIAWWVKACENVPALEYAIYEEVPVYIGTVENRVLTGICPERKLRSDYTMEEIHFKRERYQELKKLADEARSALHPFGE